MTSTMTAPAFTKEDERLAASYLEQGSASMKSCTYPIQLSQENWPQQTFANLRLPILAVLVYGQLVLEDEEVTLPQAVRTITAARRPEYASRDTLYTIYARALSDKIPPALLEVIQAEYDRTGHPRRVISMLRTS
jgi:hypothetical protein